jgi:hypothetical protein
MPREFNQLWLWLEGFEKYGNVSFTIFLSFRKGKLAVAGARLDRCRNTQQDMKRANKPYESPGSLSPPLFKERNEGCRLIYGSRI